MITEGPLDTLRLSAFYYRGWRSMTQKTRPDALTDPFHLTGDWSGSPIYNALAKEMGINPAPNWFERQRENDFGYWRFYASSFFPSTRAFVITGLGA